MSFSWNAGTLVVRKEDNLQYPRKMSVILSTRKGRVLCGWNDQSPEGPMFRCSMFDDGDLKRVEVT